jgi:hypothetical protein
MQVTPAMAGFAAAAGNGVMGGLRHEHHCH